MSRRRLPADLDRLNLAWLEAVKATATIMRVRVTDLVAADPRRGWRPPKAVWDAKKVAIYGAVGATGCRYAPMGRAIGLHRDTIAEHCASVRQDPALRLFGELVAADIGRPLEWHAEIARQTGNDGRPAGPISPAKTGLHPTRTTAHGNVIIVTGEAA